MAGVAVSEQVYNARAARRRSAGGGGGGGGGDAHEAWHRDDLRRFAPHSIRAERLERGGGVAADGVNLRRAEQRRGEELVLHRAEHRSGGAATGSAEARVWSPHLSDDRLAVIANMLGGASQTVSTIRVKCNGT